MKLNNFEVIGISLSVASMAAALWFINLDTRTTDFFDNSDSNTAAIVVADGENQRAALSDALIEAGAAEGELSRLVIDDVVIGVGDPVESGDMVTVEYIGSLTDGTQFDNSYRSGSPFTFEVGAGRVIPGWDQGLVGMQVGGQRVLVIPSELAYGNQDRGPIPANSTLVFAIELIEIN